MALSERKGRFLVTTACVQPVSPAAAASPAISASSDDQRVQKRKYGRFTVSTCQAFAPSSTSPAVAGTQAAGPRDALQLSRQRNTSFSSLNSSERDASPFAVADQHQQACAAGDLSLSSWDSSSSLCSKASSCSTAKAAATPTRRVRFSEPDCDAAAPATPARYCGTYSCAGSCALAALQQKAVLQAVRCDEAAALDIAAPHQQHYVASPTGSVPKPIMRSYCRGRFMVQEAVLYSNMPRSMSVPERRSTLEQFVQVDAATGGSAIDDQDLVRHSSGSSNASESSSSDAVCRRTLLQDQQQQQQQSQAVLTQAVVAAAAAAGNSFWAAASAAHLGDTSALGCTLSDDFAVFSNAAAAAAAGPPSRACRPYHHPPKRSQTVSYFRRGRFLVQTTYT